MFDRDKIIEKNIGFVVELVKKYLGRGAEYDDLLSEGIIGLIKAHDRYDPDKGASFTTYAQFSVEQYVKDFIERETSLIRKPKRFYRRSATKEYQQPNMIRGFKILAQNHVSLEDIVSTKEGARAIKYKHIIPDETTSPEEIVIQKLTECDLQRDLQNAISLLKDKEKKILKLRYGQRLSQKEIGTIFGVTESWICQREKRILAKLNAYEEIRNLHVYLED